MKISKERFCTTLNAVAKTNIQQREFGAALEKFCDTPVIFTLCDNLIDNVVRLLEELVDDTSTTISWWLWENVEKELTLLPLTRYNNSDKPVVLDVSTAEKLYDYFDKYCGGE